jgi:hypothetical protein
MIKIVNFVYVMIILLYIYLVTTKIDGESFLFLTNFLNYFIHDFCFYTYFVQVFCRYILSHCNNFFFRFFLLQRLTNVLFFFDKQKLNSFHYSSKSKYKEVRIQRYSDETKK